MTKKLVSVVMLLALFSLCASPLSLFVHNAGAEQAVEAPNLIMPMYEVCPYWSPGSHSFSFSFFIPYACSNNGAYHDLHIEYVESCKCGEESSSFRVWRKDHIAATCPYTRR